MFISSPIPSVSHPGFTHFAGTECELGEAPDGSMRLITLTVRKDDGEVDWTEQFLLPLGMQYNPRLPRIILPPSDKPGRKAEFVVEDGKVVALLVAIDDPAAETGVRYQRFPLDQIAMPVAPKPEAP
jgi:hypothetical protein